MRSCPASGRTRPSLSPSAIRSGSRRRATVEPSTEECLRLAARGRISAWDAEFVFVADAAGLPLVSADRKLVRAFPGRVVALEDLPLGR